MVPDFCGMSMETANEIIKAQVQMKNLNMNKTSPVGLSNRNLRDNAPAPLVPMKPSDYGRPPSSQAVSAATTSYPTPQSPTTSSRQNLPPRTSSIEAQKAAEAAISGMRPTSQPSQGLCLHRYQSHPYTNKWQTLDLHSHNNLLFVLTIQRHMARS